MSDNLRKDSFWVGGKFTVQEIIKNSKRKILQIAIHEKNRNFLYKSQNKNIPSSTLLLYCQQHEWRI